MDIFHQIVSFAADHGLTTMVGLIAANLALGIAVAIKNGEFRLYRVGDIFSKVGPMVIGYLAVDLLIRNPELTASVLAVVIAQTTGDIMKNLAFLYPSLGSILPDALTQPSYLRSKD